MKRVKLILFLFLMVTFRSWSQQPSHFILGGDELIGVDIYDLHQDKFLNYWIASNNGIYKFDGYDIEKIECEDMRSNSVFNLVENEEGYVYCHNLNGQIFEIKNDTCVVYFTVPDSLMNHDITIEIDDNNRLIVFTKLIFEITEDKTITELYSGKLPNYNFVYKTKSNALLLFFSDENKLIEIKNGAVNLRIIDVKETNINVIFFEINNTLIAFNRRTGEIIPEMSDSVEFQLPKLKEYGDYRRYYTNQNNLWIANLTGGAYYYKNINQFDLPSELVFKSTIISSYLIDNEGNSLFGTFGKGIIVIPNTNFVDFDIKVSESDVTHITKTNDGNIIVGTQAGEVIRIDSLQNIEKLVDESNNQIEILEYLPNMNTILFNGPKNQMINTKTLHKTDFINGAIKDLCYLENQNYLFSTNIGLLIYSNTTKTTSYVQEYMGRSYSVGYDSINKTIYYGTASGLKIGKFKEPKLFKLDDKNLQCSDIQFFNGLVYVATKNHGVLVFKNDVLVDTWSIKTGLLSDNVKLIKQYNDKFYLATDKGLNILSNSGEVLNFINTTNGLNARNVLDFEVSLNRLWVVTNRGIQNINLMDIQNESFSPNIQITAIHVNNQKIDSTTHTFEHTDNKFVFEIASKSLKYRTSIYYEYQLVGLDNNWIKSQFDDHIFEYKSLQPNNYTFKVRAIYGANYSKTITYNFKITKPYWARWWFYSIIIILFLSLVFIIFKIQIKRQKRKTLLENQLNLTQLTALKSQMNPHFIFNSLNSIQDLILQQDRENAYNYISKFALLVRKILHHSDKAFIEIEEEIKILSVYLELEELRFKKDFSFNLNTNTISDLELPPMLIQPFVENALKHGLLHKKGDKHLAIEFKFENNILTCTIQDNGIGRKKSNEIKQRQNKIHDSFSVKSISTRFDILKNLYGKDIGVDIIDLFELGKPCGTKVILQLPYKRRF